MDLKEILNLHQNLFKNKLVGENAVARVHGSCSFRFMGSCPNIIFLHNITFLLFCAGMLAYLRKLVQFFSNFNPCLSTSIPWSRREISLPGTRLALATDHRKQFQCLSKVLNNKIGPSFLECS